MGCPPPTHTPTDTRALTLCARVRRPLAGHLCEFHGLDMEMVINEHYFEVLSTFSDLFIYMFDNLKKRYSREMEAVRAQYPFEDLEVRASGLRGGGGRYCCRSPRGVGSSLTPRHTTVDCSTCARHCA